MCCAQGITQTSVPLGDALDYALQHGSLVGKDVKPYHIKVHVFESTNPESDYHAEIEEYWVSDQEWRRQIDSPDFKQTKIVNQGQTREDNTGDYYPLWLKEMVTAVFDPVPNREHWDRLGAKITQITLPNGMRSDACAREQFKVGSDTVQNDAFSNVCFDGEGLLKFVGSPGYGMEFHDYQKFSKQKVARSLRNDPEPGTTIMAKVVLLEELKKPDPSLFTVVQATPAGQQLQPVVVSQNLIESAAGDAHIVWPPVPSGKTAGLLTMYISVDRTGAVREAYPLNSDNAILQDAVRDQLLKWKFKPIQLNSAPVQAEAAMSFRFETRFADGVAPPMVTSLPPAPVPTADPAVRIRVSSAVIQGLLLYKEAPQYPPSAKERHVQGDVLLSMTIDTTGVPRNIRMVSSPDESLTDAAVAAVTQWRYRPYLLNGKPVEVDTTALLQFNLH